MQTKTENPTPVTTVATSEDHLKSIPQSSTMQEYVWEAANFTALAFLTSTLIVVAKSPINAILLNFSINGTLLSGYTGGISGLYAGTKASLSGSALRTGYVTGAKNSTKPIEDGLMREEGLTLEEGQSNKRSGAKIGSLMCMAGGETIVTQIPESLSQLKKVPGLLPADFKWKNPHNAYKLMTVGFPLRYAQAMVNFWSLCLLEDEIAKELPFQDKRVNHFTAGALSGMSAAFFAYPFAAFKDRILVQSHVKDDGLLYNESTLRAAKKLFNTFCDSPLQSLKSFGKMSLIQAPIRMGATGLTFALIAGAVETIGKEPLKKVVPEKYQPSVGNSPYGLFANSKRTESEPVHAKTQEPGGINQPK